MPISLPAGMISVSLPRTADQVLSGARTSKYKFEVLNNDEEVLGEILTVEPGGSVAWSAYASIKSGGSITVTDRGGVIDWLNTRIRPVCSIAPADTTDYAVIGDVYLGVYIPSAPVEDWGPTGRSWRVELLDKTSILDQDIASDSEIGPTAYAAPAGSNVIELVVSLIEGAGETAPAIEPASITLPNDLVWDISATRLKVINDLLDAANYFSLYCDELGQFRADPYIRPTDRIPEYEALNPFSKGEQSLMSPSWTRDRDIYAIPNRYVCVSQGDEVAAALVSVATNTDPTSEFSYPSRGRWITAIDTGIEVVGQEALDAIASRRLASASGATQTMTVYHPLLPGIRINRVIRLTNPDAGIDLLCSVSNTEVPFDPTSLCKTTLRVVTEDAE